MRDSFARSFSLHSSLIVRAWVGFRLYCCTTRTIWTSARRKKHNKNLVYSSRTTHGHCSRIRFSVFVVCCDNLKYCMCVSVSISNWKRVMSRLRLRTSTHIRSPYTAYTVWATNFGIKRRSKHFSNGMRGLKFCVFLLCRRIRRETFISDVCVVSLRRKFTVYQLRARCASRRSRFSVYSYTKTTTTFRFGLFGLRTAHESLNIWRNARIVFGISERAVAAVCTNLSMFTQ